MADNSREVQEMKRKSAAAAGKATDPVEKLRLLCLARGASGIKGLSRSVLPPISNPPIPSHLFFIFFFAVICLIRAFRIMDDDGSKSLDLEEFKKGLHDYGLATAEVVSCVCLEHTAA